MRRVFRAVLVLMLAVSPLSERVNEQPFTRSLSGVEIPADVAEVSVRARDSVHGYGGAEMTVAVPH